MSELKSKKRKWKDKLMKQKFSPTFCTVHNKEELYKKDKWKKFLWRNEVC